MNFVLIGSLGKMGREIASCIDKSRDRISFGIDMKNENMGDFWTFSTLPNEKFDVDAVIDFSTAKDRADLFEFARKNKLPYGLFSTAVSKEDEESLRNLARYVPVLRLRNTSIGINLIYQILEEFSSKLQNADVILNEYHHKQKKDCPSGTAKEIEAILRKNNIDFQTFSHRVGNEKGFHQIQFFLGDEILEISHRVNSRKTFAEGSIEGMHKLASLPSGFYNDMLSLF